jgi:type II secretory pathway pseudopilin PulG
MNLKRGFLIEKSKIEKKNKRGQVWVETVIYTLIAFSLMGLVLAFVIPKIEETQDKGIIEQSIGVLQDIDSLIRNLGGPGNQRTPEIGISKGSLTIDGVEDKIFFELESKYQYGQPGENITIGKIVTNTKTLGKINRVTLTLNYTGVYNLKYSGADEKRLLSKAPVPYNVIISDEGTDSEGKPIINIDIK